MNEYGMIGHEGITLGGSVAAWFLFLLLTIVFVGLRNPAERRALLGLAVGAYVLKTILAVLYFDALVKVGLNGFAGIDPGNYHHWAIEMARDIKSGRGHFGSAWRSVDPGYSYICSYLYTIFGSNTLIPRFLGCAMSSAGTIYVYRIAKHFFGDATARLSVWLYLFLPFTLLIVIDQRKDAVVSFLALGLLWHVVRLVQIPFAKWQSVLVAIFYLFCMHYTRSAFIWPFLAVLVVTFAVSSRNIFVSIGGVFLALLIFAAALWIIPEDSANTLEHSTQRFVGKLDESEKIANRESGLLRFARVTSIGSLWKAPIAGVAVLLLPFPPLFTLQHLPSLLASWANLFVVALLPALFWGIYLAVRQGEWRRHFVLLIYPLVFVALVGILHPDVTRYRETAFPAIVILMSRGWTARVPAVITVPIYAALSLLAAFVYLSRAGQL